MILLNIDIIYYITVSVRAYIYLLSTRDSMQWFIMSDIGLSGARYRRGQRNIGIMDGMRRICC